MKRINESEVRKNRSDASIDWKNRIEGSVQSLSARINTWINVESILKPFFLCIIVSIWKKILTSLNNLKHFLHITSEWTSCSFISTSRTEHIVSTSGFSVAVTEPAPNILTLFLVDTPTLLLHIKQWVQSFSPSAVIVNATETEREIGGKNVN